MLCDPFAAKLKARGLSENTIRAYTSDVDAFESWVDANQTGLLVSTTFDGFACLWLNEFRDDWSPKTTQRRMTALRTFGRSVGWAAPMLNDYRPPSPARPIPHPIPEGIQGVERMLVAASTVQHRALIALCGLGGLRCNEARTLPPGGIDTSSMLITVMGKGRHQRSVPLTDTTWGYVKDAHAQAVMHGYPTIVNLSDRAAREAVTQIARRAGIKTHISSHDLRATFATAVYAATKDVRAVQELLGHKSSKQTEVYTDVPMDTLRKAAVIL